MKEKGSEKRSQGISRKDFVKLAGTGAAVVAGTVLAKPLVAQSGAASGRVGAPAKWDREADVVVVGYGFSGACAAIAAKDAGANVLILEKSATAEGGNSGCSTGSIHTYLSVPDPEVWIQKIKEHSWGTVPDEDAIRAYVSDALKTKAWLEKLGMKIADYPAAATASRSGGTNGRIVVPTPLPAGQTQSAGVHVFAFEHNLVTTKGIPIMFSTPATELIQDPVTKEILGVKAMTGVTRVKWSHEHPYCYTGGKEIFIKAKKAVVLSCGGYENNPDMQFNYNSPGLRLFAWGTPNNCGDGIAMALGVNADLWHMHGLEWSAINFKKASELVDHSVPISATTAMVPGNHIFVNRYGKRFMNEVKNVGHDISHKPLTDFNQDKSEYTNQPFWVVMDETQFKAGPLCPPLGRTGQLTSYNSVHKSYEWSKDNSKELAAGWIFKADSISELAAKIRGTDYYNKEVKVDPAGLVDTVSKFNAYATAKADPDFGRPAANMAPLVTGPFYAVEMSMSTINTQGGPRRDKNYQTVGIDGKPIPRLFNVGELGSINGFEYVCGNITEAHTTGRVAGQNAAALKSWS